MEKGEFSPMRIFKDWGASIDVVINDIVEGLGGGVPIEHDLGAEVIYNHACNMEASGDLPVSVTAHDVYDRYVGYSDGTDR